jgi:hypothetical protein
MNLDGEVIPAKDIKISFRIANDKKVSKVTFGSPLSKTREISYKNERNYIKFNIPSFEVYSLATIYYD